MKAHPDDELRKHGITVKALTKRISKVKNKQMLKSDVELKVQQEEEKLNANVDQMIIQEVDKMKFTFPFMQMLVRNDS